GYGGTSSSVPAPMPPNMQNLMKGVSYSRIDADAYDPTTRMSSRPFSVGIQIPKALHAAVTAAQLKAGGGGTPRVVTVPRAGTTGAFPWNFFDVVTATNP